MKAKKGYTTSQSGTALNKRGKIFLLSKEHGGK
jgi:hypothetical protein